VGDKGNHFLVVNFSDRG